MKNHPFLESGDSFFEHGPNYPWIRTQADIDAEAASEEALERFVNPLKGLVSQNVIINLVPEQPPAMLAGQTSAPIEVDRESFGILAKLHQQNAESLSPFV